ncbi:uncharacterized mitochondrial protein-like protein [Tanacetum coccineum]
MGELTFFLGLQVQQKKDGIFISHNKYVGEILKKFGFIEIKTTSTPIETQKPLLKEEDGEEVDVHMYSPMIGSLMYLTSSRPDIMFAVCGKVLYLHDVKRIFSVPSDNVADKAVNEKMDDSLELLWIILILMLIQFLFRVHDLDGNEVIVNNEDVVTTAEETRSVVEEVTVVIIPVSVATTTTTITAITDVEMTLAQALAELNSAKPKADKVNVQDKGKGKMVEPEKPMKKKELSRLDE